MHFKHPFILFALFLLVLPIIVHFFQLQKFVKVPFTNVKFLKNIILQNRQSSKLKKLLVLLSRLLLFTFLILAFAEPYLSKNDIDKKKNVIVFLDNSYSMQAKHKDISLFASAIQELIKKPITTTEISLLTNNEIFVNLNSEQFKIQISKLKHNPKAFNLDNALLRISSLASDYKGKTEAFIISDFQTNKGLKRTFTFNPEITYTLVKLEQKDKNISIDSIYINDNNVTNISLIVILKSRNLKSKSVSVSLFNDNLLVAKSTVKVFKNKRTQVQFNIENTTHFNGKITIEDSYLKYDNSLYFVINKVKTTNVLAIGAYNKTIQKLYNSSPFNLKQSTIANLDFTIITQQQIILLNELHTVPPLLTNALKAFTNNGGTLVVMPGSNSDLNSYATLFKTLGLNGSFKKVNQIHQITGINYSHPLLNNVFEKQVKNFDYPSTQFYYQFNGSQSSSVIKLDNNAPFINQFKLKNGNLYFLAAPLDLEISTFSNSPLIVPIFYNIALQGDATDKLYYNLTQQNSIAIQASLKKDEVLTLTNNEASFIPLQHIKQNKVILETDNQPDKAGFYAVAKADLKLQNLAFNINRQESDFRFYTKSDLTKNKNTAYFTDLSKAQLSFINNTSIFELWQVFMGLALLFLLIEILLLKHLKS